MDNSYSASSLFFTADTHFGHKNIIQYCDRPFKDTSEMDEQLIKRWNEKIPRGSTVFHLGDVFLCSRSRALDILDELNGTILWVPGNHDKVASSIKGYTTPFHRQLPLLEIYVNEGGTSQQIVLCHYALRTWSRAHHGAWHLYGHSHAGLKADDGSLMSENRHVLSMDVGVDTNDFYPYSYQEIKEIMGTREFRPNDHHSAKMSGEIRLT